MIIKNAKPYFYKTPIVTKDDEANTVVSYNKPKTFLANIYPNSGNLEIKNYGLVSTDSLKALTHNEQIAINDVVEVYNKTYQVKNIDIYSQHRELVLECL